MKPLLLLLLTQSFFALSQDLEKREPYFFKKFEIGTSLTYIWDAEDAAAGYRYDEFSWNLNAKVSVSKRLYFGVQAIPIHTKNRKGGYVTNENYTFVGLLSMFKFIDSEDFSFHIEMSLNRSNMFHSLITDPSKKPGINYIGYGLGGDIALTKKSGSRLFLEWGFYNYSILNKIDFKSNYTQYILGLNYHFGKP